MFLTSVAQARILCVKIDGGYLRKEPSRTADVSWKVPRMMPLRLIREKDGWSEVRDLDGEVHWVFNNIVTEDFLCDVIKSPKAILYKDRQGDPDDKANQFTGEKFMPVRRIKVEGDWVSVQNGIGQNWWIEKKHLWNPY